jgi:hypothetical protein
MSIIVGIAFTLAAVIALAGFFFMWVIGFAVLREVWRWWWHRR